MGTPIDYRHWLGELYALWPIAIATMYLGFVAPIMTLRRSYGAARQDLVERLLPSTTRRIADAHAALDRASSSTEGSEATSELNDAIAFRKDLEDLPGLPLSGLGRRLLTVTSLFPIITFVIELLAGQDSLAGQLISWLVDTVGAEL